MTQAQRPLGAASSLVVHEKLGDCAAPITPAQQQSDQACLTAGTMPTFLQTKESLDSRVNLFSKLFSESRESAENQGVLRIAIIRYFRHVG